MRISENMRFLTAIANTTRSAERLFKANEVASSGLRVNAPSDDPGAYAAGLNKDGRISRLEARSAGLDGLSADLTIAEGTLGSAVTAIDRVKELTISFANGTINASDRLSGAQEIKAIRETLVGYANARGASGYLFAGTKTDTVPFTAAGAFVGNDNSIRAEIADGVTTSANVSGAKAFTAVGGRDVFADLDALATAFTTNDVASIKVAVGTMDTIQRQFIAARTDAGLAAERLKSSIDVTRAAIAAIKTARASDIEADAVSMFSNLQQTKNAYERSLEVTKQVLAVSALQR